MNEKLRSRTSTAEQTKRRSVSHVEDKTFELIQSDKNKEKRITKRYEESLWGIWDTNK